jgi:ABC-type lipoprotein release transport system permease subunit
MADISNALGVYVFARDHHGAAQIHYQLDVTVTFGFGPIVRGRRWNFRTPVRRTPEIGIRMALGAQPGNVLRMVLSEMALLVAIGVAIGIPASFAATHLASRLISDLLYGLKGTDVPTVAVAVLLLMVVAIGAGCSPPRRASRVDPILALRYE